jgi:DNA-binding response OmpR family regulator
MTSSNNSPKRASDTRLLIIDDDERLTSLLSEYLGGFGFSVRAAKHPEAGLRMLKADPPDLLILDVMLPEMDGLAVCRKVRETSRVPIVMLTARGDVTDRIVGLELGADDYLPKPFEPRELVARIQAVLRRGTQEEMDIVRSGAVEVNFSTRTACVDGRELALTSAEFELLGFLVRNPGRVLSRERIMEGTHGINWEAFDRSIDVLISRLRQKLGDEPRQPVFIRTVRGVGYSFMRGAGA